MPTLALPAKSGPTADAPAPSFESRAEGGLLWLWIVVLLAVAIRAPGLNRPLVGHYATKNVTYAMIARNWVEGRASLWRPTMDCMTGGQRGWHLLELPISAYVSGAAWSLCGGSLDVWGRLVSVVCSAAAVAMMFVLVRRWHGQIAARGAALALALAPPSILFGQSFMLEASVVALSLATFLLLDNWLLNRRPYWLALASVALALLLLTKIYMLVLAAPLLALVWRRSVDGADRRRSLLLVCGIGLLAVAPAAIWYAGVAALSDPANPDSAHVFYSVRQSATAGHWPHPLLTQADFYRQALDDLTGFTLTPLGFALVLAACLNPGWRRHAVWLASMLLLVAVLPGKFHVLKYYHLVILPPFCVLAGLGWQTLAEQLRPSRKWTAALMAIGLLLSLRYAARPAFVTPQPDCAVVPAATALQMLAESEEPVVTMHGTTTDLLYYCNRPGWAMAADDGKLSRKLNSAVRQGAGWLVVADLRAVERSRGAQAELARWPLVAMGGDWQIYRLAGPPSVARSSAR